jgi:hypothetical protein
MSKRRADGDLYEMIGCVPFFFMTDSISNQNAPEEGLADEITDIHVCSPGCFLVDE